MRVLVVSNQYAPVVGGIEVLLRQLCPALRDRGHEVSVLTSTHRQAPEPRSEVDGITVHRVGLLRALAQRDPAGLARGRKAAVRILHEVRPEVVHGHDPGPNLWTAFEHLPEVPVLTTLHLGVAAIDLGQRGPTARLLGRSAWLTGVSQAVVDEAVALVPSLADRSSVVVNGLPVSGEPSAPDPAGRRIVAAGRMTAQKGFDVLLRALPAVLAVHPTAELLLVGDGPARPELAALAEQLGIAASVRMPGAARHDEMAALLESASVVAIPSRYEGMPLIALEAAAAGRAVVATPVQGLADVVVDGETGLLVPPEQAEPLAAALVALLGDPARAAGLGASARCRVVERFSLDRAVDAYDELFRRLASSGVGAQP